MGKWRDSKPSQMDSQRALLDELMGVNRNLDNEEGVVDDFKDERVCKAYLCGLCPHDLFSNTKQDLGACDYLHDEELKRQYEADVAKGEDYGYDKHLESILVNHIQEVDKKISRSQRRLEEGGQGAMAMDTASLRNNEEIMKMEVQMSEIMKNAEAKGEEGDVDEAQELFEQAEELQRTKAELEAKALQDSIMEARAQSAPLHLATSNPTAQELGNATQQKLRVCDICGALLSIFDSNDRLAEHFGGKLHIGFVDIRTKLESIHKERVERLTKRQEEDEKNRRGGKDRDAESRSSSRRDGDRRDRDDKDRDRDRRRDRSGDRSRDRGRDRSKGRSRDRSKGRSRDRSKGRSRDRSRERSRDRRHREDSRERRR
ncbi:unnamed protein product [Ectocarpus sp. 6 AP-2014]